MKLTAYCFSLWAVCHAAVAPTGSADPLPTLGPPEHPLMEGLVGGIANDLDKAVSGLLGKLADTIKTGDRDKVLDVLRQLKPARTPESVEEAVSIVETVARSNLSNIVESQAHLIANGIIAGDLSDLFDYASGVATGENGHDNRNPDPPSRVYPKAASCDAPYSTSEKDLRSAIFIPESFTYGEKPPVVLFPGSGSTGYLTFKGNFIPLLSGADWADPVWVNVPGFLLDDAQINAEYAAYALNYIASLTGRNVSIIAWSQGNIDTQWAFKYWPSTRKVTSDHVAVSADYKGTVMADVVNLSGLTNDPAVLQQDFYSHFIRTLRSDGGDSGYVPTTSLFSGFVDLIVQPQSGVDASAHLGDAREVGVTNAEAQAICAGQIAGSLYTHENMLVNPLTFALARDALTHHGPGDLSRLDLKNVCSTYLAPGLGLSDFLLTENSLLLAALTFVLYLPKAYEEPDIMDYATRPPATC